MFWRSPLSLLYISTSLLSFNTVALRIPSDPAIVNLRNASSFPEFSTNLTNLGAFDPRKFLMVVKMGDDKIAPAATLMNAVDAMVQLSLMDTNGQLPRTTFRLDIPKYSQVEIVVGPISTAPGATLPPGIAVLGLFKIILYILTDPTKRFKSIHSYLSYERREVGTLEIRRLLSSSLASLSNETDETASGTQTTFQATHLLNTTADLSTLSQIPLTAPAWQDPHLDVSIVQGLDTFTIYEAFFAVLAFIHEISVNRRTTRVQPGEITIDTPPITVAGQPITISWKSASTPPGTAANPPYFQLEWLIKGFGQLPQYMIEHASFRDVLFMGLKVDGVQVGECYMVRKQGGRGSLDTTS